MDKIGGQILSKLMYDWRLMDELGLLRTIYLLGSGNTKLVLINMPIFVILQGSYLVSSEIYYWFLIMTTGDLLQHFLTVIFNKLDKGESWDDDFELNMVLQVLFCDSKYST